MVSRIVRVGYFWPTIEEDCAGYSRKCIPCQKHDNIIHNNQEELHHVFSPWPFSKMGMDIIVPFITGKGQVKFLSVGIDYFFKWIEATHLPQSWPNKYIVSCGRILFVDMVFLILLLLIIDLTKD